MSGFKFPGRSSLEQAIRDWQSFLEAKPGNAHAKEMLKRLVVS